MKQLVTLIALLLLVSVLSACGGTETDDGFTDLATTEDAVKYVGIDGSNQECATCSCSTDSLGNCVVLDEWNCYYAMCSSCTANAYGGVTFTPAPTARPRATTGR